MTAETVGERGHRDWNGRDRRRHGGDRGRNGRAGGPEAAEAHDDAILDMIALEMAADDPSDFDDVADMASAELAVAELALPIPSSSLRNRSR